MKGYMSKVREFLVSEDGPTATEYAVMLALIIIVANAVLIGVETSPALWERYGGLFNALNAAVQVVFVVEIAVLAVFVAAAVVVLGIILIVLLPLMVSPEAPW